MPGTLDDSSCVSPTPTTSSSGGGGDVLHDARDCNGRSWSRQSRSSSALDRHSESSESLDNQSTSSGTGGRPMQDFGSSEYIPTRSTKASPKVAYNPMQFVKTGPAKLVNTAHEQLRKAGEVKKVRETRKEEAEDWQSNLEGWKSNRRKRQEHVIERVTEVKRMEQEEALKASEAAAKRLMGIREKRGKLSALYSVEDDNEITFDLPAPSESLETLESSSKTTTTMTTTTTTIKTTTTTKVSLEDKGKEETLRDGTATKETTTTAATKATSNAVKEEAADVASKGQRPDSHEFTYDKAIEQYVKYSTTALMSKQEVHSETRSVSRVSAERTSATENVVTVRRSTPWDADAASVSVSAKAPGVSDELVKKRAAAFEREPSAVDTDDPNSSRASAIAAANRRSGEFSSTFKSRLSTFETLESSPSPSTSPAAGTTTTATTTIATTTAGSAAQVAPDPQFKTKLATFHRAASGCESAKKEPVAVTADQDDRPDFKAKLAAFRQVEETMRAAEPGPLKTKPAQVGHDKPAKPAAATKEPPAADDEPIYANSTPATGYREAERAAESSDCTEDEGIRSLSPHGTASPASPTGPSGAATVIESSAFSVSFRSLDDERREPSPGTSELRAPPGIGNASDEPAWSPSEEVVWDDWVDLGSAPKAAPPTEKPPPPPLDDDPPLMTITTPTTPPTPVDSETSGADCRRHRPPPPESPSFQVTTRRQVETPGSDVRNELRKRRSDFLGFDVGAAENDAKEMADAIPPPPDLKSLVKSATDYRWQASRSRNDAREEDGDGDGENDEDEEDDEDEDLERKEREIIETLEKEERMKAAHNTSGDGIEFEMTAEIEQLAREWRNDAVLGPGWRSSAKVQPAAVQQPEDEAKARPAQQPALRVEMSSSPGREPATGGSSPGGSPRPPPLASPAKPSRLSAAPKPRFHDGEAWMAKRKAASEAGHKKDARDVSRHWLIQEAEQRRIDAMQERNYSPSSSSVQTSSSPVRPGAASSGSASIDGNAWMSRSSSSTSVDKMSELRLPKDQSRSTSSLGSSPTPRPLYANQEEILEYADFTGAPHANPPVWQVRSIVSSSSMDQLQSIHPTQPPSRPAKTSQSKSQTLPPAATLPVQSNPAQTQPSWRSTHPPDTRKEPIPPLPHSVIHTLTQRVSQRNSNNNMNNNSHNNNNNNNNNNYGDYMNVQEATAPSSFARAAPQVPPQRPANYRHPSLGQQQAPPMTNSAVQPPVLPPNNNDRMLSVSGKKKCSLCQEELGRGAAMIIESLRLFYHINCFRCCVCGIALGNGTAGTDVRVRNNNLHCHDCYSNDDGLKFSKV